MVCPSCGSNDIVGIQGQQFCINCGHKLGESASKTAKVVAAPTARPRIMQDVSPAKTSAPVALNKPASKPVGDISIKHFAAEPISTDTLPTAPTKPAATPVANAKKPKETAYKPAAKIASKPTPGPSKKPVFETPSTRSLLVAVKTALGVAVPTGAVIGAAVWLKFDSDIILYAAAAALVMVFITFVLTECALLYGKAAAGNGRPLPRSQWWMAARASFMDVININLTSIMALLFLALSGYGFFEIAKLIPLDTNYKIAFLLITNALTSWAVIGLYVTRHIAIPAVVIGGFSSSRALQLAWRMYWREGAAMLLSGFETVIMRVIILAAAVALVAGSYLVSLGQPAEIAASIIAGGVATAIFIAVLGFLEVEIALWLKRYRRLAPQFMPHLRLKLLTGRVSKTKP
ncbi:MAG TPA: hypothetical protein VNA68_00365 [Candidatus Dormibacteraeota bacterium]|nr:hypothetical protein [Candidatus Dormibacteraeota bacterium]